MPKLTDKQSAILSHMRLVCNALHWYPGPPGAEGKGAGFYFNGKGPKPEPDGRSVVPLIKRGFLKYDGDNTYVLNDHA